MKSDVTLTTQVTKMDKPFLR